MEIKDTIEIQETYADSRTYGAKSEAVRKILGLDSRIYLDVFRQPGSLLKAASSAPATKSTALPGLFNRDNECYQNSIIQGFASLPSFSDFVGKLPSSSSQTEHIALIEALQNILGQLNDPDQHGMAFWTPWALKSMSSWQQQDAQEYYSMVIDAMEKEVMRLVQKYSLTHTTWGLGCLRSEKCSTRLAAEPNIMLGGDALYDNCAEPTGKTKSFSIEVPKFLKNPLEGMLAQRVGCLRCGFVEGLSLIPFNCLTLSLRMVRYCDLESCLDSYTGLETISGVECARCTLLRQEKMFKKAMVAFGCEDNDSNAQEYFDIVRSRHEAVTEALKEQDFSESTLAEKCKITSKSRVTTDKTRQAIIARPPKALTIHINRSVFDENTGAQYKNFAAVNFPKLLNLNPWCLGTKTVDGAEEVERWESEPSKSMLPDNITTADFDEDSDITLQGLDSSASDKLYTLRAVITHYGTHGDGHYIAYRQSPQSIMAGNSGNWWRLSDEEVVQVDEDYVLRQGGVFMLFYEQIDPERSHTPASRFSQDKPFEDEADSSMVNLDNHSAQNAETCVITDRESGMLNVNNAQSDRSLADSDLFAKDDSRDSVMENSPKPEDRDPPNREAHAEKELTQSPERKQPSINQTSDTLSLSPTLRTAGEVATIDSMDRASVRSIVPAA